MKMMMKNKKKNKEKEANVATLPTLPSQSHEPYFEIIHVTFNQTT